MTGGPDLLAISDFIHSNEQAPLGAIIALLPAPGLATPVERGVQAGGHSAVLRDARGTVLY